MWTKIEVKTGAIKVIPDFDLLFKLNYEDYLTSIRSYYMISARKRIPIVQMKAKQIYENSSLIAIVDSEVPIVYSFVAYEINGKRLMVHFCYTKENFRKKGFLKILLKILETNKDSFSYSAPTSRPLRYSVYKKYKLERQL